MDKTIQKKGAFIIIRGKSEQGKSETIKNVCINLIHEYKIKNPKFLEETSIDSKDILVVLLINGFRIGIESQGDPGSRIIYKNTLETLVKEKCNIILCASRTGGETVRKIDSIADNYGYKTLWRSNYYAPNYNHKEINKITAEEIINIIKLIIKNQI